MSAISAPIPPGALGQAAAPQALLSYLEQLTIWVDTRRRELDELDQASQSSPMQQQITADVMLSMALWQAVKSREELLLNVWDSGRVGIAERERLSTLIWGRLDTTTGALGTLAGMNVSLPEACRLSDALASSLRGKLALDPNADEITARITTLKASLERLRDQVQLEPVEAIVRAQANVATFSSRLDQIVSKVSRGGDVGGLLAPLEQEMATFERDLIVSGTKRRQAASQRSTAEQKLHELHTRGQELAELVATVIASVDPAPKYAVPQVSALGPIPDDPTELATFLARLDQVDHAMSIVDHANHAALEQRAELVAAIERAKRLLSSDVDSHSFQILSLAEQVVTKQPTQMAVATNLVNTVSALLDPSGGTA